MKKYRFKKDNVIFTVSNINEIPNGMEYETIDFTEILKRDVLFQQEIDNKISKNIAYEELLHTDWYVVRFIETGIAIPEEILRQRQAIREKYK